MATANISRSGSGNMPVQVTDPFTALRQEMNDWISNVWGGNGGASTSYAPALDVSEKENNFELRVDIPGMDPKDLDIQVRGNTVTITGQRKDEREEKGKTWHRVERRTGSFSRTITLPCEIDEKEVAAEYTNGVLSVTLPKSEQARPRKINIKG
jgi:HSP20 family protein